MLKPALVLSLCSFILCSCASYSDQVGSNGRGQELSQDYTSRLPSTIATKEKLVLVDPNVHACGAYDGSGNLMKAGLATAGGDYCPDIHRPCHTHVGSFRIHSLGSPECKSS